MRESVFQMGNLLKKGNFLSLSVGSSYCRRMWWVLFRNKLYLLWGVERPWSLTIYRDFLSFFSHMISISSSFWFSFSFSYLCVSGTMVRTRGAHSKKTLASHSKIPFDIPDGTPLPSASAVPHSVSASSSSVGKRYKMKPPKQVALISTASPLIFPNIGVEWLWKFLKHKGGEVVDYNTHGLVWTFLFLGELSCYLSCLSVCL